MNLNQWAIKWGVPYDAVEDLRREFGTSNQTPTIREGESEAAIQTRVRLEAAEKGIKLLRNNVGVLKNIDGVPVRYGLANDSKALNKKVKSADLIGIKPILITKEMIGYTIGQFISRETKPGGWKYSDTERERAQLRWGEIIISLGGDAAFCNSEGTL